MEVLARHSARLGAAGPRLEAVMRKILVLAQDRRCDDSDDERSLTDSWSFLDCRNGMGAFHAYQRLRRQFVEKFDRLGRTPLGDAEVFKMFTAWHELPEPEGVSVGMVSDEEDQSDDEGSVLPGGWTDLPLSEVRFSHNDQSEHFGRGNDKFEQDSGCVLQLTLELLSGITNAGSVPTFNVCRHGGRWWSRSGNRRLAAFQLARRFAPERFERIRVKIVAPDEAFTVGLPGRRPKLTTHLNGPGCQGRWIVIKETGHTIGRNRREGSIEYGADLISLLPLPPNELD